MKRGSQSKSPLDLIEEATHLLRTAPSGILAIYYVGTIPFILGLVYFWTDMGRNPFANQHIAEAALAVSLLFLWMKFWQVAFTRRVRARFTGEPVRRLQPRRAIRSAAAQTVLQPLGLLPIGLCIGGLFYLVPLGMVLALLVGFVLPFFHNVTAVDDGTAESVSAVFKKAWRSWWIWPRQNFMLLAILYFFALYVFLNWSILCLSLPALFKTLFGVDSVYSQSPMSMMNSTFIAAMFSLTYLCVDPILKTVYTLRSFYGESVKSGEDLKSELKAFSQPAQTVGVAIVALLMTFGAATTRAADASYSQTPPEIESQNIPSAPPVNVIEKPSTVSTPDLDHAIDQTIHERKYTWRMPREQSQESNSSEGVIARFFDRIANLLRKCLQAVLKWWENLLRKLFRHAGNGSSGTGSGEGWITLLQLLLFVLIVTVVCALALLIFRLVQQRRRLDVVASEPIQSAPDLTDENVGADQLPEDGWTKLARELLERGEFRLAMRAFYLASLAHLAQRNLISIARFKSNHEYERELRRRAHAFPDLLSVFGDNLTAFERIWYGLHDVNNDVVSHFASNVERMKGAG